VVTLGQLPLIFLLSSKNNFIGYLSGVSYERLNWLHRWCARTMLLTATIHMGYFFTSWAQYDYIGYKLKNDNISWKGLAAWCTLVWIVFSSMTPIRGWCYELFVVQHLVSFAVFIGFVYIHIPVDMKGYVWIPVALFFFDRTLRALRAVYTNVSLFHPSQRRKGHMKGFWALEAEFTPLPHNTTRVVIQNPPISWTPGQHVFLSCQSVVPLQSHPFTVASIPEDGVMEFLIKSESGGTRRFFKHAEKAHGLSGSSARYVLALRTSSNFFFQTPVRFMSEVIKS
jgi:predicted ferric reductase